MKELNPIEQLASLKISLIKVALHKKLTCDEYKDLKENLILTSNLLNQHKETVVAISDIVNIEEYICNIKK